MRKTSTDLVDVVQSYEEACPLIAVISAQTYWKHLKVFTSTLAYFTIRRK